MLIDRYLYYEEKLWQRLSSDIIEAPAGVLVFQNAGMLWQGFAR